jgi:hypothetical protein
MGKRITLLYTGIIIIVAITVTVTYFAGSLSGRWGTFHGLPEARDAIKELPMEIGNWRAEMNRELPKLDITMLRIQDSYILRSYKNAITHAEVHVTLMVGPTGKVTVHTPVVCFGGKDYERDSAPISVPIDVRLESGDDIVDSFWKVSYTGRSLDTSNRISFYYAISTGESWQAVETPRATFQTYRYVYKIQAEAYSGQGEEGDIVNGFLRDCLPTIHEHLRKCN